MAVLQVATPVRGTGSPLTATLTFGSAITAGSTLVVLVHQSGVSSRTFTVTEAGSGTGWETVKSFAPGISTGINHFLGRPDHPGGVTSLTVTHSNSTANFACCAIEFEATSAIDLVASEEYIDAAVTDDHKASAAGLTTSATVLGLISAGAGLTNFTDGVATGSWTKIGGTDQNYFFAYQLFASGTSSELGSWTSTGTDRIASSGMVLLGTGAPAATGSDWVSWLW